MSRRAFERLQAEREAWAPWRGGPCPFCLGMVVTVLLNDGSIARGEAATWCWRRDTAPDGFEEPDEIVAYRRS